MKREPPVKQAEEAPEEIPMLLLPGLGAVQARHGTIASAHFQDLNISFFHSERRTFVLKAAPDRETLSYLKIFDSSQRIPAWPDFNRAPEFTPQPVPFETIIADFETNLGWVRTSREGMWKLGIGKIKGDVATPQEAAELFQREERMAAACVREADKMVQNGKSLDITNFHRSCLKYLGLERDWGKEIEVRHTKIGPLSGARIPAAALSDAGIDLLRWYGDHPELRPEDFGDDYVASLFKQNPGLRKKPASA